MHRFPNYIQQYHRTVWKLYSVLGTSWCCLKPSKSDFWLQNQTFRGPIFSKKSACGPKSAKIGPCGNTACVYTASLPKIRWICLKSKEIGGKSVDFSKSTEFGGKLWNSEASRTLAYRANWSDRNMWHSEDRSTSHQQGVGGTCHLGLRVLIGPPLPSRPFLPVRVLIIWCEINCS